MVKASGRKEMADYGERLRVKGAILAGRMIDQGEVGRVIHVEGFRPRRPGPEGCMEIRKHVSGAGVTGHSFFGQLIPDCLSRTKSAMTQAHALKAAELCLRAQAQTFVVK